MSARSFTNYKQKSAPTRRQQSHINVAQLAAIDEEFRRVRQIAFTDVEENESILICGRNGVMATKKYVKINEIQWRNS